MSRHAGSLDQTPKSITTALSSTSARKKPSRWWREHTAQVTTGDRAEIEDNFKGGPQVSPVNLLSCSPTLEMGIDVGGLDAVVIA